MAAAAAAGRAVEAGGGGGEEVGVGGVALFFQGRGGEDQM